MIKYFRIISILYRVSLILAVGILIVVKRGSMTGFDYIPPEFYLMCAVPVICLVILTVYLNLSTGRKKAKHLFRQLSVISTLLWTAFIAVVTISTISTIIDVSVVMILALFPYVAATTLWALFKEYI